MYSTPAGKGVCNSIWGQCKKIDYGLYYVYSYLMCGVIAALINSKGRLLFYFMRDIMSDVCCILSIVNTL